MRVGSCVARSKCFQELPLPAGARLAIGARNALGAAGDGNPTPMMLGNLYSARAPFDVSGTYAYARLGYRWGSDG